MDLLAWNIMHGGGPERLPRIALALLDRRPDVIVLSEYRAARGGGLRAVLADHGWTHQASSLDECAAGRRGGGSPGRPGPNGVLVASRTPLAGVDRHESLPPRLRRRVLTVGLAGDPAGRGQATITAAHVPDARRFDAQALAGKAAVWHEILRTARSARAGSHVVVGDLNTGRHRLDEPGATFSCTALLGGLASLGYVDAWRARHADRREGSWTSRTGASFRLDHAFVSASLAPRVVDAWYCREGTDEGLSDHAALCVRLCDRCTRAPVEDRAAGRAAGPGERETALAEANSACEVKKTLENAGETAGRADSLTASADGEGRV